MTATQDNGRDVAYALGQMRHYYGNHISYQRPGNVKEISHPELGRWIEAFERQQSEVERLRAALIRDRGAIIFSEASYPGIEMSAAREELIAEGLLPPE